MGAPRFSAVIPAYNAEDTLADSIRSVLSQTAEDLELLIVDDGSSDDTNGVARSFEPDPRVTVTQQTNSGLAASRNVGIARARGEFVAFLDSDDLWMPRFLEATGAALDAAPDAGFAYTDGWTLNHHTRQIRRTTVMFHQRPPVPPPSTAPAFLLELVERNFVLAEATVRMSAIAEVGPFNAALPAVEDYDLWLRMALAGYRGVCPDELLLIRRFRSDSMSSDLQLMYRAHCDVLRMVLGDDAAPDPVRRIARTRIAELDRLITDAGGATRPNAKQRARALASEAKRRALGSRIWLSEPPPEVAEAFPELFAIDSGPGGLARGQQQVHR